jgi:taurine dioxygenase
MSVMEKTRLAVVPSGAALGADITGFDPAHFTADDMALVRQALFDHLVVRIRGTDIDDAAYERFGAQFGTLKPSPDFTRSRPVYLQDAPAVTIISNVTEDGKPIGEHGDGELNWHTDLAFTDEPSALTMLLAREVPPAQLPLQRLRRRGSSPHLMPRQRPAQQPPALDRSAEGLSA